MTLDRRQLLRVMVAGGSWLALRPMEALAQSTSRLLWFHVQASGGWDQALFCDPKPGLRTRLTDSAQREVVTPAGSNIPYLRFADFSAAAGTGFFAKYANRLLVFNGVDTATNNHAVGERYSSSGSINDSFPCWSAQVAASLGQGMPLAFLVYGGYDAAAELVVPSRVNSFSNLRLLTDPNSISSTERFLHPSTTTLLENAHRARLQRFLQQKKLPGQRLGAQKLLEAREAQASLSKLTIPTNPDFTRALVDLAFNAFEKSLAASANLTFGGFDSHDSNESDQSQSLQQLLGAVSYILDTSEARGLPAIVVMTSDFGRTPHYTGGGTDHWPASTIILALNTVAQQQGVALPTNRVIGGTTANLQPLKVHPGTLQLDSAGVVVRPGHVYRALRRVAGIAGAPALSRFPIEVDQELTLG